MIPHSRRVVGNALSSFGKIEQALVADSKGQTADDCESRETCLRSRLNRLSSYSSSSVRLLGVTFISLAVIYFLLRCFDLTRERYRVARLTRSLAAGGVGACHGDEEDGEDAEWGERWNRAPEGTAMERWTREYSFDFPVRQGEGTLRLRSMPTVSTVGGFRGGRGVVADRELATTASQTAGFAEELKKKEHSAGGRAASQYPQHSGVPPPGPGGLGRGKYGGEQNEVDARLLQGETWEMWEGRNLPHYAEVRLESVFKRMGEAASACRSLLGVLTQSQQLRLSYEVMRLLSLELGAISLVPQHLEHLRSNLGDTLIKLGIDVLQRSVGLPSIDAYREPVCELITLVRELQQPRLTTEENVAHRYRKKMLAILQTATAVVGYCLGLVERLLKFKNGESLALPSSLFEQQMNVLKALYDVHSAQVSMDASLRYYIVDCQKRTRIYLILGLRHLEIRSNKLPPLREMVDKIHAVVANAGGLLPAPEIPHANCDTPVASPSRASEQLHSLSEFPSGTHGDKQQGKTLTHGLSLPRSAGVTGSHGLQPRASSSQVSHPVFPPSRVGHHAHQRTQTHPLPSLFPHPRFNHFLSVVHPQAHDTYPKPSQTTTKIGLESMLPMLTSVSERGNVSWPPPPYLGAWQEPEPQTHPHHQRSGPAPPEASAHAAVPGYPSYGRYSTSDQAARHPLPSAAAGPAGRVSGGAAGWHYGTTHGGTSQHQEAEPVESVGGLLGELLKGGLKIEDVFPDEKPAQL